VVGNLADGGGEGADAEGEERWPTAEALVWEARKKKGIGEMVGRSRKGVRYLIPHHPALYVGRRECNSVTASLSHEKGFVQVIFASGCLSLMHRLNSKIKDRFPIGMVI
jgi:hypothetical protein